MNEIQPNKQESAKKLSNLLDKTMVSKRTLTAAASYVGHNMGTSYKMGGLSNNNQNSNLSDSSQNYSNANGSRFLNKANSLDPNKLQINNLEQSLHKLKLTPKTSIDRVNHPKFLYHLCDQTAELNMPVVFEARVELIYQVDTIKWYINGHPIVENPSEDIQILQKNSKECLILTLVLGSFEKKYIGEISCVIENVYGKSHSKCYCSLGESKFNSDCLDSTNCLDNNNGTERNSNPNQKNTLIQQNSYPRISNSNHHTSNNNRSIIYGHRKLAKISSGNARLYNLDENSTVECQGYSSDVMTALEEENKPNMNKPERKLSQTQQYLKGFIEEN